MRCVRSPAHLRLRTRAHKLAFTPRIVIETNSELLIHPNRRNLWTYTQFICTEPRYLAYIWQIWHLDLKFLAHIWHMPFEKSHLGGMFLTLFARTPAIYKREASVRTSKSAICKRDRRQIIQLRSTLSLIKNNMVCMSFKKKRGSSSKLPRISGFFRETYS